MTPHLFRDMPLRENIHVPPPNLLRDVADLLMGATLLFVLLTLAVLLMGGF